MVDFGSVNIRSIRAQLDLPRTDESASDHSISAAPSSYPLIGRAQSDERYRRLMQAKREQLLSEAYDQFEISLTATQIILVQKGGQVISLSIFTSIIAHAFRWRRALTRVRMEGKYGFALIF